MMIRDMTIRHLRGIKECRIHDLGQINLLIGKNSAGKSTILESIQLVSSVVIYPAQAISSLVNRRSDRSWHPQELWYKYNTSLELSVSLLFDDGNTITVQGHQEATPEDRESIVFYASGKGVKDSTILKKFDSRNSEGLAEQSSRGRRMQKYEPDRKSMQKSGFPDSVLNFLENTDLIEPTGSTQTSVLERDFQS